MDMLEIMKKEEAYCSDHRDMPGELQKKAKMLCWRYNQTSPEEGDARAEILRELLGTCHPLTFIEPSFRCDYGFNIHTHGLTVINYNCVILDTSPVHIGENAFIAPGVCIACSGHSKDAAQRAAGIGTSAPVTRQFRETPAFLWQRPTAAVQTGTAATGTIKIRADWAATTITAAAIRPICTKTASAPMHLM